MKQKAYCLEKRRIFDSPAVLTTPYGAYAQTVVSKSHLTNHRLSFAKRVSLRDGQLVYDNCLGML